MPKTVVHTLTTLKRSPPEGELASARGAVGSIAPYNPDDLIGTRGYAIYDQMQRDSQVQACLTIKKSAVLSRGWEVHPASDDPKDREVADFVRFALNDMRGSVLDVLHNALDALAKGFSVMELNYKLIEKEPYKGMIGLSSIKSKDPSTFNFDLDEYANIRSLGRVDFGTGVSRNNFREALPPEKFVVYSHMPRYESPYGTSDLRAAYKHYWSKDLLTRFLNVYLEKYGSPTARGSYKRGTPKAAQEELLKVIDKIQQQTAIIIPDDVQVDLMEAHRGGEAGYLQAIQFHDKQIAKSILSQTLVVDEGSSVGSFALAKVHLDILRMCLLKLKRDIEESVMQEQVIRRLVDYNFNVTAYPTFCLGPLEDAAGRGDFQAIIRRSDTPGRKLDQRIPGDSRIGRWFDGVMGRWKGINRESPKGEKRLIGHSQPEMMPSPRWFVETSPGEIHCCCEYNSHKDKPLELMVIPGRFQQISGSCRK